MRVMTSRVTILKRQGSSVQHDPVADMDANLGNLTPSSLSQAYVSIARCNANFPDDN